MPTPKQNYSVLQMINKLVNEGYKGQYYDEDRASAAALDMLSRGTLPIVEPPKITKEQRSQRETIKNENRQISRANREFQQRRKKFLEKKRRALRKGAK